MGKITRNRVMYAGTDVLVSDAPSWSGQDKLSDLKLLKRVQTSSISISNPVNRTRQIGSSEFSFQKYTQNPEITVGLSYYMTDNSNELMLGLISDGTSGIFSNFKESGGDRNLYFALTDADGQDAHGITNAVGLDVFAVGNAFLDTYSLNAQVGNVPTVDLSFNCINMKFDTYAGIGDGGSEIPAINLPLGTKSTEKYLLTGYNFNISNYLSNQNNRPSALRPGDINLQLEQPIMGGVRYSGESPANITSMQINLPLQRRDLIGFGSNFPYDKRVIFPIVGTIAFEGYIDEPVTGDFSNIFDDENEYDFVFNFKDTNGATGMRIEIDKARVESQSFDQGVGDNLTFSSEFSFAVSATDGFRISGASRFLQDDEDAIEFLDAVQEQDTDVRSTVETFVETLKSEGIWDKVSGIYPFIGNNYAINLKDPRDLDEAFRLSFSSTDTEFENGYIEFKGEHDYANTHFKPGYHLAGNEVHISVLNLINESSDTTDIGCIQTDRDSYPRLTLFIDNEDNDAVFELYNPTQTSITVEEVGAAFYVASRDSDESAFLSLYNDNSVPTKTSTATFVTDGENAPYKAGLYLDVYVGAANVYGSAETNADADRKIGFLSFGDGLSQSESNALHAAVKTMHLSLGRLTNQDWLTDFDASNYLTAVNETNSTNKAAIITFVATLKNEGIWDKMLGIYPMFGDTSKYSYNLKDPRDLDAAYRLTYYNSPVVNNGGIYFVNGFDYADTHFNPSSDLSDYSVHLSFLSLIDGENNAADIGCREVVNNSEVSRLLVHVRTESDQAHFDAYTYDNSPGENARVNIVPQVGEDLESDSFYIASRINNSSSFFKMYKNNETRSAENTNTVSSPKPNASVWLGQVNNIGNTSSTDRAYGFFSFGQGLTTTEAAALHAAVKTLYTSTSRHSSIFSS